MLMGIVFHLPTHFPLTFPLGFDTVRGKGEKMLVFSTTEFGPALHCQPLLQGFSFSSSGELNEEEIGTLCRLQKSDEKGEKGDEG